MLFYRFNIEAVGLKSLGKILKVFFHYKSLQANDIWGVINLDLRGMVGNIYVGDHLTMQYTKYISCRPHGLREFLKFSPL